MLSELYRIPSQKLVSAEYQVTFIFREHEHDTGVKRARHHSACGMARISTARSRNRELLQSTLLAQYTTTDVNKKSPACQKDHAGPRAKGTKGSRSCKRPRFPVLVTYWRERASARTRHARRQPSRSPKRRPSRNTGSWRRRSERPTKGQQTRSDHCRRDWGRRP